MKKITLFFILFCFSWLRANQRDNLSSGYIKSNSKSNKRCENLPLMDKQICMSFKFTDEFSNVEYQETVQTKTDAYGMVNLIIGSGLQTGGYASSFSDISWSTLNKKL
jgi:hypothetical protein